MSNQVKNCFTIAIDMDDTIENLVAAWVEWLNQKYGYHYTTNDVKSWQMSDLYRELSDDQIMEPLFIDEFWLTVAPKPDAIKYVEQLVKDGHDVYICTCSHYDTVKIKFKTILERFFPCINWKKIIIAANKQMIRCDIMIDDAPHNLIGGSYLKILMDAPHNRDFDESEHGIKRAKDWEQIYTIIQDLDWFYSCAGLSTINY